MNTHLQLNTEHIQKRQKCETEYINIFTLTSDSKDHSFDTADIIEKNRQKLLEEIHEMTHCPEPYRIELIKHLAGIDTSGYNADLQVEEMEQNVRDNLTRIHNSSLFFIGLTGDFFLVWEREQRMNLSLRFDCLYKNLRRFKRSCSCYNSTKKLH